MVRMTSLPDGIIVIDKPRGPTSHQVTAWAGELLKADVGHSGTLDPQVSGVLLVMKGKAVRLAPLLLRHEKEYVCLMRLHGNAPAARIHDVARGVYRKNLPETAQAKCRGKKPENQDHL